MISPQRPGGLASMGNARAAVLVALVWMFAALPFVLGAIQCPTARLFHFPCPGCGMTRAFHLLADGALGASLRMHPLAVPTALAQAALMVASIVATLWFGAPWSLVRARSGRAVLVVLAVVMAADVILWLARAFGALGGAVPV